MVAAGERAHPAVVVDLLVARDFRDAAATLENGRGPKLDSFHAKYERFLRSFSPELRSQLLIAWAKEHENRANLRRQRIDRGARFKAADFWP